VESFVGRTFPHPVSHPLFSCFATRWLWLLNQVDSKFALRQQASHLLLIRTDFGYGTVVTAACARPGCIATDFITIIIIIIIIIIALDIGKSK
jgi:hypothetical protein